MCVYFSITSANISDTFVIAGGHSNNHYGWNRGRDLSQGSPTGKEFLRCGLSVLYYGIKVIIVLIQHIFDLLFKNMVTKV